VSPDAGRSVLATLGGVASGRGVAALVLGAGVLVGPTAVDVAEVPALARVDPLTTPGAERKSGGDGRRERTTEPPVSGPVTLRVLSSGGHGPCRNDRGERKGEAGVAWGTRSKKIGHCKQLIASPSARRERRNQLSWNDKGAPLGRLGW
jgi:hypothetical protein